MDTFNPLVLFDSKHQDLFERSVKPLLDENWPSVAYPGLEDIASVTPSKQTVLVWLGDDALHTFIPYASEQGLTLGFLPHPDMNRFYRAFPIPKKMEEALEDIQSTTDPVLSDLLFCNAHLVLGSVMVGNPSMMRMASNIDDHFLSKLKYLTKLTFNLNKASLSEYKLRTEKGSEVNTAALGVTFVYRPSASEFTKRVIGEAQMDQSTLHAIILAPRSISEVVKFLISRIFPREEGAQALADYIGHIKATSMTVSARQPIHYTIDSIPYSDEVIELKVQPNCLKVLSQALPQKESVSEVKESVAVSTIPKGQAVKELVNRSLPWIHHVDHQEVRETFVNLKENAQLTESYLVLMVLSTLLATVGLFANSAPVIIGAMILAPLMSPIISLSMGVLRQNLEFILTSAKTLSVGVLLALMFGTLLTLITPLYSPTPEILARLSPTILDLGVAIFSGIAAAYASARSEVAKSLAGVAIAVALVPPLAVAGIGIGWLDWHTFASAFLLFVTNLVGIVLASSLTFLVMGFSPFKLAKKGVAYALGVVLLISIPLNFSFANLVEKQRVTTILEGFEVEGIELRDVQIKDRDTLYISATLLSNNSVNQSQVDQVKQAIEQRLERAIQLEARVAILR